MKLRRLDFAAASLLAIGYFAALAATSSGVGYVRDEGHYFHAGASYARWFEALWDDLAIVRTRTGEVVRGGHIAGDTATGVTVRVPGGKRFVEPGAIADAQIVRHPDRSRAFSRPFMESIWRENFEHPALMKVLFVWSHRVFYERLGWLGQGDAYRLPAWCFAALLVFLTFLWGTELWDARAGFFAAATLMTMPHVFFHAHLACFDVPVVTMWIAVLYAFWKSQRSLYWAITMGPLFGVALATKLNSFFLPFILLAYFAVAGWRELGLPKVDGVRRLKLPRIPIAFFSMLAFAPFVYYALWPLLWHAPFEWFDRYLSFHLHHEHYDTPYLGTILKMPPFPWHFPFVMSLLTVPEMTVLLGTVGFCGMTARLFPARFFARLRDAWGRRKAVAVAEASLTAPTLPSPPALFRFVPNRLYDDDPIELLLWLGCFVPFAIIAHPKTPIFGGTKHWMTAMPIVALFAAAALHFALGALVAKRPSLARRPNVLFGVFAALVLSPSFVALARTGPYGTSYHNLFAGGLNGAARVGNTIQFWGPTLRNVAGWLNQNAEPRAGVCHHETNSRAFQVYQREGILRADLVGLTGLGRECDYERADYQVYQHMQEYQHDEVATWQTFGTVFPVHVVALDGMPLVSIYKKPIRFLPDNAAQGDVLYGRATVGAFTRSSEGAISISAWRRNGGGRGQCEGVLRGSVLEQRGGSNATVADADDAYRTLIDGCFGSRLPR